MPRDKAAVIDILNAAQLIVAFLDPRDAAGFGSDLKTQSAVLHQLLILGEATKRLSSGFRDCHGHIPWRMMAGMRDRLIHGYDAVDPSEVWQTVTQDVPELIVLLDGLLISL